MDPPLNSGGGSMGLRHSSGDGQTWPEKGKSPLPLQMSAMYSYAIDYHVCATNRRTTAGAVMLIYCKILWNKLTVNISERIASLLCLSRDQFPWRSIYFQAKFTESRIGRRHRHITTVYTRADCFVMGSSVIISLRCQLFSGAKTGSRVVHMWITGFRIAGF